MRKLDRLRDALRILGSSYAEQVAYLGSLGHFEEWDADPDRLDGRWNIDELGLQFDDSARFLRELVETGEVEKGVAAGIYAIDSFLVDLSGSKDPYFWTLDALKRDPRWETVRKMAKDCLSSLT